MEVAGVAEGEAGRYDEPANEEDDPLVLGLDVLGEVRRAPVDRVVAVPEDQAVPGVEPMTPELERVVGFGDEVPDQLVLVVGTW